MQVIARKRGETYFEVTFLPEDLTATERDAYDVIVPVPPELAETTSIKGFVSLANLLNQFYDLGRNSK